MPPALLSPEIDELKDAIWYHAADLIAGGTYPTGVELARRIKTKRSSYTLSALRDQLVSDRKLILPAHQQDKELTGLDPDKPADLAQICATLSPIRATKLLPTYPERSPTEAAAAKSRYRYSGPQLRTPHGVLR